MSVDKKTEIQGASEVTDESNASPAEVIDESNTSPAEVTRKKVLNLLHAKETFDHFLNSPEMLQHLEKNGPRAVNVALKYLALFKDGEGLFEFLDQFFSSHTEDGFKLLRKYIAKKLGLEETESSDARFKICDYFKRNYMDEGKIFHSFNAVFQDEIEEHGLDPDRRIWDQNELTEIDGIFKKYGRDAMGYSQIDCIGKLSVTENTRYTYLYALASPEWFDIFTSVHDGNAASNPFQDRNYEEAKHNVEKKLSNCHGITEGERRKVMEFFERHWNMLASPHNLRCALIAKSAIRPTTSDLAHDETDEFWSWVMDSAWVGGDPNGYTINKAIAPQDITIVDLPYLSEKK
jgi:hypothetical protein